MEVSCESGHKNVCQWHSEKCCCYTAPVFAITSSWPQPTMNGDLYKSTSPGPDSLWINHSLSFEPREQIEYIELKATISLSTSANLISMPFRPSEIFFH